VKQQATLELVPALRAPRAARAFVAETLTAWNVQAEKVEAAQLVVSELVTNAVLHAADSPTISLDLRLTDGAVRVLVSDGGLDEPTADLTAIRRQVRPAAASGSSTRSPIGGAPRRTGTTGRASGVS
jgi:anti-sigma regulatory factor (Ser/Thr protein kinase)